MDEVLLHPREVCRWDEGELLCEELAVYPLPKGRGLTFTV